MPPDASGEQLKKIALGIDVILKIDQVSQRRQGCGAVAALIKFEGAGQSIKRTEQLKWKQFKASCELIGLDDMIMRSRK